MMQQKHLIDTLLFGERNLLVSKSQVEENMFVEVEVGKEVENQDYEASIESNNEEEEKKDLIPEQNEHNQYGSQYVFSYKLNIVFQCGKQGNHLLTIAKQDHKENDMEEVEEIEEENVEQIFK